MVLLLLVVEEEAEEEEDDEEDEEGEELVMDVFLWEDLGGFCWSSEKCVEMKPRRKGRSRRGAVYIGCGRSSLNHCACSIWKQRIGKEPTGKEPVVLPKTSLKFRGFLRHHGALNQHRAVKFLRWHVVETLRTSL